MKYSNDDNSPYYKITGVHEACKDEYTPEQLKEGMYDILIRKERGRQGETIKIMGFCKYCNTLQILPYEENKKK